MNNTCICCGEIIPEGRQICVSCEQSVRKKKAKGVAKRKRNLRKAKKEKPNG